MQILNQIEDLNIGIYQIFEKNEKFKTRFEGKKSLRVFN